jgi:hypothetical protein
MAMTVGRKSQNGSEPSPRRSDEELARETKPSPADFSEDFEDGDIATPKQEGPTDDDMPLD